MRVLGRGLIFGIFFFVGVQLSNMCLADEIQRSSGGGQFVKLPAGASQPSLDRKSAVGILLVPIKEFVSQSFPSPLPFQHFQKIRAYAQDPETVPKLISLLEENCESKNIDEHQRLCSNIVTTLGVLGSPTSLSRIREFIDQGISGSNLRVLTDAVRALGIGVNVNVEYQIKDIALMSSDQKSYADTSKKTNEMNDILGKLLDLASIGQKKSKTLDEMPKVSKDDERMETRFRRLRRAALQGLALSGTMPLGEKAESSQGNEIKKHLEHLLAEAKAGTSYRAFIIELLNTHNIIAKVGLACYLELENDQERSDECKARWLRDVTVKSNE